MRKMFADMFCIVFGTLGLVILYGLFNSYGTGVLTVLAATGILLMVHYSVSITAYSTGEGVETDE